MGWVSNICKTVGILRDFPGSPVVKNLSANAGDVGSIPGLGRSPVEGNSNIPVALVVKNPPVNT